MTGPARIATTLGAHEQPEFAARTSRIAVPASWGSVASVRFRPLGEIRLLGRILRAARDADALLLSGSRGFLKPEAVAAALLGFVPGHRRPTVVLYGASREPAAGIRGVVRRRARWAIDRGVLRYAVACDGQVAELSEARNVSMAKIRNVGIMETDAADVSRRLLHLVDSLGPRTAASRRLPVRMVRGLLRPIYQAVVRLRDPRFAYLRSATSGMMPVAAYRRIYEAVREIPGDFDVVEVGVGGGAGTVAAAWALQDAGAKSRLIAVDRMVGGSRVAVGDHDANLDLIRLTLDRFGVTEQVDLYVGDLKLETGAEVLARIQTPQLGGLIHDADGRIDRDFLLFWPRLVPGGLIVVDDVTSAEPKSVVTKALLDAFSEWGLFELTGHIGDTAFGRKPPGASWERFDADACAEIVEASMGTR